jgi:endonuclease/exonuclease/phosphatase family metal-dependent hydrolase
MLRVLTYNVHRWLGTDRRVSPERTAAVIAACRPDVAVLQEVRVGRTETGIGQLAAVADALGMTAHFHPTVQFGPERFGLAVLTALPSRVVRTGRLPGWPGGPPLEPRGALWVAVEVGGAEVQVINTHLGLFGPERLAQAEALIGPDWLGSPACREPAILAGDLNASSRSRPYKRLLTRLRDAQLGAPEARPRATFHSRLPLARIDHLLVSRGIEVLAAAPVRTVLTRQASDHLPLVADLNLRAANRADALHGPDLASFRPV